MRSGSFLVRLIFLGFFLATVVVASVARASFLQMTSQSLGDQYTIKNNGDESSRQVRPFVKAGNWTKEFDAVDLGAGESHTWTLPMEEMQKQVPRGRSPMPILIRYQDANGYPFSVPELKSLETSGLSPAEQQVLTENPLRASLTVEPLRHNEFRVRYALENLTAETLTVTPKIWTPEELRVITVEIPVELKAHGKLEGFFQIHNEKALAGSYYNLFATFEFKQKDLANFVQVTGGISVTPESFAPPFQMSDRDWWSLWAVLFASGLIALRLGTPYLLRKR